MNHFTSDMQTAGYFCEMAGAHSASRSERTPRAAREKARAFRHQDNVLGNEKTHLAGFPIARSAKSWAMPARFAEFSIKIDPGLLGKLCALS
jgi:hypothetical protein